MLLALKFILRKGMRVIFKSPFQNCGDDKFNFSERHDHSLNTVGVGNYVAFRPPLIESRQSPKVEF